jgi:hypothetical protein
MLKFVVLRSVFLTLPSEQLQRLWGVGLLNVEGDHGGGGDAFLDCCGGFRGGRGGGIEVVINCC